MLAGNLLAVKSTEKQPWKLTLASGSVATFDHEPSQDEIDQIAAYDRATPPKKGWAQKAIDATLAAPAPAYVDKSLHGSQPLSPGSSARRIPTGTSTGTGEDRGLGAYGLPELAPPIEQMTPLAKAQMEDARKNNPISKVVGFVSQLAGGVAESAWKDWAQPVLQNTAGNTFADGGTGARIAGPIVKTGASLVDPLSWASFGLETATHPGDVVAQTGHSIGQMWNPNAPIEERVQGALDTIGLLFMAKHGATKGYENLTKGLTPDNAIANAQAAERVLSRAPQTPEIVTAREQLHELGVPDAVQKARELQAGLKEQMTSAKPTEPAIDGPRAVPRTTPKPIEPQATQTGFPDTSAVDAEMNAAAERTKQRQSERLKPVTADRPGATGLANQVQEREALDSIISEVETTKGKGAKDWQREGRAAVEDGTDFHDLAKRIGSGEEELTGKKVGILTEGKRLLVQARDEAQARLLANPGNKDIAKALDAAETTLDNFLSDVQAGKGRWSDVGRALQAGTTYNEGDFASVIEHLGNKGVKVEGKLKAQLEDLTGQVSQKDRKIAELQSQLDTEKTTVQTGTKPRKYDRTAITKEIDQLWEDFKSKQGSPGVKQSKTRGAVAKITAKDIEALGDRAVILGKIVKAHIKLHAGAALEDVVVAVQKAVKSNLGIEIDRQAVIDLASQSGPKKTRTELQKQIADLQAEFNRESSAVKITKAEKKAIAEGKASEKQALQQGKQAIREADAKARESTRTAQRLQEGEASLKKRSQSDTTRINTAAEEETLKANAERRRKIEQLTKTREDIADLRHQLETGDYRTPTKKEAVISKQLEDLRAERTVYANKVRSAIKDASLPGSAKLVRGVASGVRGLVLGTDLGQLTRQGLFAWSRPKAALKGVAAGARALVSEANLAKIEGDIADKIIGGRRVAPIRIKAGLSLTDSLTHNEELAIGRVLSKIPGLGTLVGKPLERAQLAFINTARSEIFDAGVRAGFSDLELKTRARFINAATGRGNVRNVPRLMEAIMTSPRYEASRWQTLWEAIRSPYDVGKGLVKGEGFNRGAVANVQDLAVTAASAYGVFKMAEMAGYTVNWNPTSPDFLKMRRGDEVWDISSGLAPRLRDIFRLFTAVVNPDYQHTVGDVLKSTGIRTISPTVRLPIEQGSFAYQRASGSDTPKSPFSGTGAGPGDEGIQTFTPLIFQSTKQAYDAEGPTSAFEAFLKELVGSGVNRYPAKN